MKSPKKERQHRSFSSFKVFRLHPLFLAVGVWFAFTGELFLFFISTLVALQHECAHAFAAAKLGYKLNTIVLMPFGAIIDIDMQNITLKDEIFVALCGPLCNLCTAVFFLALWWLTPTMYAFTDVACYASLSIAAVNLLPAYPLDGGRILQCALTKLFLKSTPLPKTAERKAATICRAITLTLASLSLLLFLLQIFKGAPNLTLFAFGVFLWIGGIGNRNTLAAYEKTRIPLTPSLKKGIVLRRVAISADCPVKDALRFLDKNSYLVLEVYYEAQNHLFDLPQNEFSRLFSLTQSPYESLLSAYHHQKNDKNTQKLRFFM